MCLDFVTKSSYPFGTLTYIEMTYIFIAIQGTATTY
jgi:hypothetical protein